jgi:predicted nuclease of predicted toxin-antitoxin system
MKFLLDMPVSPTLADVLGRFGHEGVHVYSIGKGTASDHELFDLARRESRIIITSDLDFSRLLFLSASEGPGIILFRGGNYSDQEMRQLLERVLKQVSTPVLERSICVVDKKRVRITQLPLRKNPEA